MQLVKAFPDRNYPVDSWVSVMLTRSDYKVIVKALEIYKDKLMEVKYKTGQQLDEKEVLDDNLWELANNIGPALFQEGE